jgi:hypothetical protein
MKGHTQKEMLWKIPRCEDWGPTYATGIGREGTKQERKWDSVDEGKHQGKPNTGILRPHGANNLRNATH